MSGKSASAQCAMDLTDYVEVCGNSEQVWRFAAGTKAGFAVKRIQSKLGYPGKHILCIAAVKDEEEPVEFGPDAELVMYGDNWRLKLVQDEVGAPTTTDKDLISEFYREGKIPKGSKPEFTCEYIGKLGITFALLFLFGAALAFLLEKLPQQN